jgi:hypothetical protein
MGIPLDEIFESFGGERQSYSIIFSKFPPILGSLGFVDILNKEGITDLKLEPMALGD